MKLDRAPKKITGFVHIALLIALIAAQWGPSSSADNQVSHNFGQSPGQLATFANLPVLGDFDGDRRLDRAELHLAGSHSCIHVRFGDSRESHLSFRTTVPTRGTLLARDINHDNKPDLIWVFHYQSAPAVVWLGDGLGHFALSTSNEGSLFALLFGGPDPQLVGETKDEQLYLIPSPVSSELARATNLEAEINKVLLSAGRNRRRDLGLYLSYLRERGPPTDALFV